MIDLENLATQQHILQRNADEIRVGVEMMEVLRVGMDIIQWLIIMLEIARKPREVNNYEDEKILFWNITFDVLIR